MEEGNVRITIDDLLDDIIDWYSVDKNGKIIEFSFSNCGAIPEFVCASKKNTEILDNYFSNIMKYKTDVKLTNKKFFCKPYPTQNNGVYVFDAINFGRKKGSYMKQIIPLAPLMFSDLPKNIQEILSINFLDIDVDRVKIITVKNAFE